MHYTEELQVKLERQGKSLPKEVIEGIECYVSGARIRPVGTDVPWLPRRDALSGVTLDGDVFHSPGCAHWDTGQPIVPLLTAIVRDLGSCDQPARPPRPDHCRQCGAALSIREQSRGRCDDCQIASLAAA